MVLDEKEFLQTQRSILRRNYMCLSRCGELFKAKRLRLLPLEAHHTHNKPLNTMLTTTIPMLPTTQYMNSS